MISRVTIANYKSIEKIDFEARRVNVFTGEPNSGKSNILEAIGLAHPAAIEHLASAFRAAQAADFFYDQDLSREIAISLLPRLELKWRWDKESFSLTLRDLEKPAQDAVPYFIAPNLRTITSPDDVPTDGPRLYRFREMSRNGRGNSVAVPELLVPFGENLAGLLSVHKPLRDSVSALFRSLGYRLELRPTEGQILMTKEMGEVLYSFPFESISETVRRIVFYKAVLEANQHSTLILDEPEANTFPFYTKYLAERIALDSTNQFFLSTHNPYVLSSIIEKTAQVDLAVYVTRMRNFQTELRLLSSEECAEALDLGMDFFLNLDRYWLD